MACLFEGRKSAGLTREHTQYFSRSNIGTINCRLCQTIHMSEANYMAHTTGRRHVNNAGRREAQLQVRLAIVGLHSSQTLTRFLFG